MNILDYDAYQVVLGQLLDTCITSPIAAQDLVRETTALGSPEMLAAIDYYYAISTETERQQADSELAQRYFPALDPDKRAATLLFTLELGQGIKRRELQTRFASYRAEQALFTLFPKLLDQARENELLPRAAVTRVFPDGVVALHTGFSRLDPMLDPFIVDELEREFPDLDLYLRLDPDFVQMQPPKSLLEEQVQVPARYQWWRSLGLYRGEWTGGQYCLRAEAPPAEAHVEYLDYHSRGFRKLETITDRRDADHLTMMLEELQMWGDGLMIGRCIHLDTRAPHGTAPRDATVLHVDLAINVYTGAKVAERLTLRMHEKEKVKACFRTHLLRAEGVPFAVLTMLSQLFFESDALKVDLFADQFSEATPSA
jgi:hypothetical protein